MCLMQLVLALGMMVNSPITAQLPASVLWPLIPLMANRVLEALCFLLGYITPLVRTSYPHGIILLSHAEPPHVACSGTASYHEKLSTHAPRQ